MRASAICTCRDLHAGDAVGHHRRHAARLHRPPENREHPDQNVDQAPLLGSAVGSNSGELHTRLFVGPKLIDLLESIHTTNGENLETS